MCDITRRSVCYGDRRRQWNPVKLSKWELPIQNTTYWEDICHQIEKKYKKVRDPYPSPFSYPFPKSSSRSTSSPQSDDIKFKISPPTPRHHVQKSTFAFKDNQNLSDKSIVNKGNECNVVDKNLKLPPVFQKREKTDIENDVNVAKKSTKIYNKDFCPQHKNTSSVKIFDDKISKYLKKRISSVPKLPKITKIKSCLHKQGQSFRSSSASSLQSKANKVEIQQLQKITKTPKLGTASLLPSFAKAISFDSYDTRESIESDDGIYEVQPRAKNETNVSKRDFLCVPNFSFVNSHPSFRNLSTADSYNETGDSQEIASVSEGDFLQAEKYLKPDSVQDFVVEDTQLTSDHESSNVDETKEVETVKEKDESIKILTDLERKYAYKALDLLRKQKHKLVDKIRADVSGRTLISVHDIESVTIRKDEHPLKSFNLDEHETITICTSSRSTSGLSADFKNRTIKIVTSDNNILGTLPKTVVYQRPSIDRCLACLSKPFFRPAKVYHELPLTTLKYIVENPTDFRASSSSSSCSSSSLSIENSNHFISDRDVDTGSILLREDQLSEISEQNQKEVIQSKDQIKVSFDDRNLYPTSKASSETLSTANRSTLSKEIILDKSFSIQSSDHSKTSSPSLQSSDSDEPGFQDNKLPSSKSTAPCHAPVLWRKSFEPLRALRQKKFVSLRVRAATVTAKSSDDSGSDSDQDLDPSKKQDETKTKTSGEDSQLQSTQEKKKKPLLRMKTVAEQLTIFSCSSEDKARKKLKRSKSTFDLTTIPDDSESTESKDDIDSENVVKPEEKDETLPYFELILLHRVGSPPPPIMSAQEIAEIIKQFSTENCNASDLLNQLGNEFLKKLKERLKLYQNNDNKMYIELGINLFQALLDSRRYLKSDIFDPNLEFSHEQPPLTNSRQLRRILPPKSFELVAPILGMPLISSKKRKKSGTRTRLECSTTSVSEVASGTWTKWDKIVHPPSSRKSDKHVAYFATRNPYASFLKKPRRKVVVWRPLREEDMKGYDPEATLEMRAARLMNKICKNFCDWLKELGGTEQVIDEETLKDMFEINFTAEACKAMQVILKEMPTIPGAVARARNCRVAGELEATRHELRKDIKLESRSKRIHAFGRSLPDDLRFVPPSGRVSSKWVECKNIPRDLETMDVVWNNIMDKDIVSAFIDYLKESPQAAPLELQKHLEQKKKEYFKMTQTGNDSNYIILDDDKDNLPLIQNDESGI